jgi:hypothetical protein
MMKKSPAAVKHTRSRTQKEQGAFFWRASAPKKPGFAGLRFASDLPCGQVAFGPLHSLARPMGPGKPNGFANNLLTRGEV